MLQKLTDDMKSAMKSGDKVRLSAIRMLRAAIKDREIEAGHVLADDELLLVLARLVKQRNDAARQYAEADRADLAEKELLEAAIFQAYMPAPLSDEELSAIVDAAIAETGASSMRDMGAVMNIVKARAQGRADMAQLSATVKARLG